MTGREFLFVVAAVALAAAGPQAFAGVAEICSSTRPILVVDEFARESSAAYVGYPRKAPTTDIDGDGSADVAHGDLVIAVCRATGKKCAPFNIPGGPVGQEIVQIYERLLSAITRGLIPTPAAVSISSRLFLDLAEINRLSIGFTVTPANVRSEKAAVLQALLRAGGDFYPRIHAVFAALNTRGIPLVTVAGNDGVSSFFNFFSLLPGSITVGALDNTGKPAAYSNANSLTDIYRSGELTGIAVPGGFDIDGDGSADLPGKALTGMRSLVFRGTSFAAPALCASPALLLSGP